VQRAVDRRPRLPKFLEVPHWYLDKPGPTANEFGGDHQGWGGPENRFATTNARSNAASDPSSRKPLQPRRSGRPPAMVSDKLPPPCRAQRTRSFETCRISGGACRRLRQAKSGGGGGEGTGCSPESCLTRARRSRLGRRDYYVIAVIDFERKCKWGKCQLSA
jgi:hypothetical protein